MDAAVAGYPGTPATHAPTQAIEGQWIQLGRVWEGIDACFLTDLLTI